MAQVYFCEDGSQFTVDQVNGGCQDIIITLALLYLSENHTIILDEPGTTLHPPQKQDLQRHFEQAGKSVAIITHCCEYITARSIPNTIHFRKQEHSIVTVVPQPNNSSVYWAEEAAMILFSSRVFIVEGFSDVQLLRGMQHLLHVSPEYFSHLLTSDEINLCKSWKVVPTSGIGAALHYKTIAKSIGVACRILIDNDENHTPRDKLKDKEESSTHALPWSRIVGDEYNLSSVDLFGQNFENITPTPTSTNSTSTITTPTTDANAIASVPTSTTASQNERWNVQKNTVSSIGILPLQLQKIFKIGKETWNMSFIPHPKPEGLFTQNFIVSMAFNSLLITMSYTKLGGNCPLRQLLCWSKFSLKKVMLNSIFYSNLCPFLCSGTKN